MFNHFTNFDSIEVSEDYFAQFAVSQPLFVIFETQDDIRAEDVIDWKIKKGFSFYKIGPRGDVWSLRQNKLMKPYRGWKYITIGLVDDNGKHCLCNVHQLVGELYVPNPNNYEELNHQNCNRHDNFYKNLAWATPKMNMEHACRMGLVQTGEAHHATTLTVPQVKDIFFSNLPYIELAKKYGVTKATICRIRTGKVWKSVTSEFKKVA